MLHSDTDAFPYDRTVSVVFTNEADDTVVAVINCAIITEVAQWWDVGGDWRRERDSNPRGLAPNTLSRRAP